ncbi:MAG: hypothetical protein M3Y73_04750 [Actinomycetota bacterium]|nr:hypothetical protein [Actinomycetota bacterium]
MRALAHTHALLAAAPIADPAQQRTRQRVLPGDDLPSALNPSSGCRFHTRCPLAFDKCTTDVPPLTGVGDGTVTCHLMKPDGTAPDVRDPDGARSLR